MTPNSIWFYIWYQAPITPMLKQGYCYDAIVY